MCDEKERLMRKGKHNGQVTTGLDVICNEPLRLKSRQTALIANQTSITKEYIYGWHELPRMGVRLKRIFSPEHGIFGTEQDQVAVNLQPGTGCEVVSLYGESTASLVPERAMMEDIDVVVFDIQDIGTRYYTYVNTMVMFMKTLSGSGTEFMVLDRPNPLGGVEVEGPVLTVGYESFVGTVPVPVRHGLTAGEIALLCRDRSKLDVNLTVVAMKGWERPMLYAATGLPWVPPSPNMPTPETAMVYPGMCLLEGTNISEGRGTAVPFLNAGAPWIDADRLADAMNRLKLPGVFFRPVYFRPCFNKYAGEICGGVYLHVLDTSTYRPFAAGLALIKTVRDLYPSEFSFLTGVYEFNNVHPAFDLLAGGPQLREQIEQGVEFNEISSLYEKDAAGFGEEKKRYHLY